MSLAFSSPDAGEPNVPAPVPASVPSQRVPALARAPEREESLDQAIAAPSRFGLWMILVFVVGFFGWSALAPLAGGALAPGVVSPDGRVRTVQHREGGIIRALHVREGDFARAGQTLMTLADAASDAALESASREEIALLATRARLEAEMRQAARVAFPENLGAADPAATAIKLDEELLFLKRRQEVEARRDLLRQRVIMLAQLAEGYRAQARSARVQLDYIREEIAAKNSLLEKGLIARPELLRLRRAEADLAGRDGDFSSQIAYAALQQQESRLELANFDAENEERIAARLSEVRFQLAAIEEKKRRAADQVARRDIVAPVDGRVVNLRFATLGGVVGAAEPILDIVPVNETLVINARILPEDVDIVQKGQKVEVRLTAFSQKSVKPLTGTVTTVSADRVPDPDRNGPGFYSAEVAIDPAALAAIGADFRIVPGMPAEVLLVKSRRTVLDYLLEPFTRTMARGMREA